MQGRIDLGKVFLSCRRKVADKEQDFFDLLDGEIFCFGRSDIMHACNNDGVTSVGSKRDRQPDFGI